MSKHTFQIEEIIAECLSDAISWEDVTVADVRERVYDELGEMLSASDEAYIDEAFAQSLAEIKEVGESVQKEIVEDIVKKTPTKYWEEDASLKTKASNITRSAQTDEQEEALSKLERIFKQLGVHLTFGTAIGKSPQTVILDIGYQGSEVSVTSDGDIKICGEHLMNVDKNGVDRILKAKGLIKSPEVSANPILPQPPQASLKTKAHCFQERELVTDLEHPEYGEGVVAKVSTGSDGRCLISVEYGPKGKKNYDQVTALKVLVKKASLKVNAAEGIQLGNLPEELSTWIKDNTELPLSSDTDQALVKFNKVPDGVDVMVKLPKQTMWDKLVILSQKLHSLIFPVALKFAASMEKKSFDNEEASWEEQVDNYLKEAWNYYHTQTSLVPDAEDLTNWIFDAMKEDGLNVTNETWEDIMKIVGNDKEGSLKTKADVQTEKDEKAVAEALAQKCDAAILPEDYHEWLYEEGDTEGDSERFDKAVKNFLGESVYEEYTGLARLDAKLRYELGMGPASAGGVNLKSNTTYLKSSLKLTLASASPEGYVVTCGEHSLICDTIPSIIHLARSFGYKGFNQDDAELTLNGNIGKSIVDPGFFTIAKEEGEDMDEASKEEFKDWKFGDRVSLKVDDEEESKGTFLEIQDTKPGDIDFLIYWDKAFSDDEEHIVEVPPTDLEKLDEKATEEQLKEAEEAFEAYKADMKAYEDTFTDKVEEIIKEEESESSEEGEGNIFDNKEE